MRRQLNRRSARRHVSDSLARKGLLIARSRFPHVEQLEPRMMLAATITQWASSVVDFSSQYSDPGWAATQALGAPNVASYGDFSNAWAPLPKDGTTELITVGFDAPVYANGVVIRETYGNGFVTEVEVRNATTGAFESVWAGTDPSAPGSPVDFSVLFAQRTYLVDAVRITTDTDHSAVWEEIDAIQLIGESAVSETIPPTGDLNDPTNNGDIEQELLNARGYIDVTFSDTGGSGLDLTTITDNAPEFMLTGAAVGDVVVNGAATLVGGTTYRYAFTGSFEAGEVTVQFIAGAFADNDGNVNLADTESFSVTAAPLTQWASSVIDFSSQYSSTFGAGDLRWAAVQTLGEPNVASYSDNANAWAPLPQNGSMEWITVGFDTPVHANAVVIRETFGNGFVAQVEVRNALTKSYETVWAGTDPSLPGEPADFLVSFAQRSYFVDAVRISVDTNHSLGEWEEIDAVQLIAPRIVAPPPTADLSAPVQGEIILQSVLNGRGYLDVTFSDKSGNGLDLASITDAGAEFTLGGAAATGVVVDGAATLINGTTYRYAFTGSFGTGPVDVTFVAGAFADNDGTTNLAETESFTINRDANVPTANLLSPLNGETINQVAINARRYIDVTFADTGGSGLNPASITDAGAEFTLSGSAAVGVTVDGAATLVNGTTYRYAFSGNFGVGEVTVEFVAGGFSDNAGNGNLVEVEAFTVSGNIAPIAVDDVYTTDKDTPLVVMKASLLINDFDPNGDALSVVSIDTSNPPDGPPTKGFVLVTLAGALLYDPRGAFDDLQAPYPDRFQYTVSDGRGGTDTATVTIWVTPSAGDILAPTADLANPANGASIAISQLNGRGYIDVNFPDAGGSGLDPATVTDVGAEFALTGAAAAGVVVNGAATPVAGDTYRYTFTGTFGVGVVGVEFAAGAFADGAGNTNVAETESFTVDNSATPPVADLADPTNSGTIVQTVINGRGYIDVTFFDSDGSGMNVATITDAGAEFVLTGAAAAGVVVNGAATFVGGTTYRYSFTGNFGVGTVGVEYVAGSFANNTGDVNLTEAESFTVLAAPLAQWATTVVNYSSQFSNADWAAAQALGAPNVFNYQDDPNAWAPFPKNGTTESLTVGFATPVYADSVVIRETLGNGFVTQVEVRNAATAAYETVWAGTDPSLPGTPVDFSVAFARRTYLVDAVRITIDTNHALDQWEEIDAVQLVGMTGPPPAGGAIAAVANAPIVVVQQSAGDDVSSILDRFGTDVGGATVEGRGAVEPLPSYVVAPDTDSAQDRQRDRPIDTFSETVDTIIGNPDELAHLVSDADFEKVLSEL